MTDLDAEFKASVREVIKAAHDAARTCDLACDGMIATRVAELAQARFERATERCKTLQGLAKQQA